jgi:hypothetical protein
MAGGDLRRRAPAVMRVPGSRGTEGIPKPLDLIPVADRHHVEAAG